MSLLAQYLAADHILLKQKAKDWRHAIEIASIPLLKANAIEPSYVTAMQNAVEEFGPYMVLEKGFALSHAKPGPEVHEVCISLITINPPVEFGNEDFDPVDILIAFGTPDPKSHINLLRELCELLNKPESFTCIRKAKSVDEIISLFSTKNKDI